MEILQLVLQEHLLHKLPLVQIMVLNILPQEVLMLGILYHILIYGFATYQEVC